MAKLARDLVTDILSRLPAKSMVRFRCASKEWSDLFFEPGFAKLLHKRSSLDWKLIARDGHLYSLDLASLDCALRADYLLQDTNFRVKKVLGCSNGKICLSVHNSTYPVPETHYPVPINTRKVSVELPADLIVICDLSTGARRVVPPSPVDFQVESLDEAPLRASFPVEFAARRRLDPIHAIVTYRDYALMMPGKLWRRFSYGFGFDPSGEDYKLVRISQHIYNGSSPYKNYLLSEIKLYSMKTNSWSRIEDVSVFGFYINDNVEAVFAGGVLYWSASPCFIRLDWDACRDNVVAFDLAKESFVDIRTHGEDFILLCLGSMGGKFCALALSMFRRIKIWKVEDGGDVWIPVASFATELWFDNIPFVYREAMIFSKNGDRVLVDNGHFIHCDLGVETAGMRQVRFISPP